MGWTLWPCTRWPQAVPTSWEAKRFRPSGPGTVEDRAKAWPSPLSVADRGPLFSLEPGLLPAPTPAACCCVPTRPVPCTERPALTSSLLWPLAGVPVLSVAKANGTRLSWESHSCNSEVRPTVRHRKRRDTEPFPREKDPPGLGLPDSWASGGMHRASSSQCDVRVGESVVSHPRIRSSGFHAPSPPLPRSSSPPALLPKYENCKSVLFISINPWQCALQGRGSHGNPANSCLKNSSCLMQSMCLMHLKVLG